MNKKIAHRFGVDSGLETARLGDFTEQELADQDAFFDACFEICENKRQYAGHPGYDFNGEPNSENLWDAFEAGEAVGIHRGWRERRKKKKPGVGGLLVLLLGLLFLAGCMSPFQYDRQIAGRALPGHWIHNHCDEYANSLNAALAQKGVLAVKLVYDWRTGTAVEDRHAIVVYKRDGRLWGMDHKHQRPVDLTGAASDLEAAKRFDNTAYQVVDPATLQPKAPSALPL